MQIKFQTKQESNKSQVDDFLKLSKVERIYHFINLMQKAKQLPIKSRKSTPNSNFLIVLKAI